LAYFWTDAQNGVELEVWATWLVYGVLADLTDAGADALHCLFAQISIEMVNRSLPYFSWAAPRWVAQEPISYLVTRHELFWHHPAPPPSDHYPPCSIRHRQNLS
jgi:hypothetical protein